MEILSFAPLCDTQNQHCTSKDIVEKPLTLSVPHFVCILNLKWLACLGFPHQAKCVLLICVALVHAKATNIFWEIIYPLVTTHDNGCTCTLYDTFLVHKKDRTCRFGNKQNRCSTTWATKEKSSQSVYFYYWGLWLVQSWSHHDRSETNNPGPNLMAMLKGTRCLGSDELVYENRLKPFVMKCIWLERCFKSRI